MRFLFSGVLCVVLFGCGQLPGIPVSDRAQQSDDGYPDLVNLRTLELTAEEDEAEALETEEATAARVARLRAKAADLRRFEVN